MDYISSPNLNQFDRSLDSWDLKFNFRIIQQSAQILEKPLEIPYLIIIRHKLCHKTIFISPAGENETRQ